MCLMEITFPKPKKGQSCNTYLQIPALGGRGRKVELEGCIFAPNIPHCFRTLDQGTVLTGSISVKLTDDQVSLPKVSGGGVGSRTYSFSGSSTLGLSVAFLSLVSITAFTSLLRDFDLLSPFRTFVLEWSATERCPSWRSCKMWSCKATAVIAKLSFLDEWS